MGRVRLVVLVSAGSLIAAIVHPSEIQWRASLPASLLGVALYYPFPVTVRVTQVITVSRPIAEVFDFVSRPSNQSLWNRRAGLPTPLEVPLEVGQEWTQGSARRWASGSSLHHRFSNVERPRRIEVVADGHGIHAVYGYALREHHGQTELTATASLDGFPAANGNVKESDRRGWRNHTRKAPAGGQRNYAARDAAPRLLRHRGYAGLASRRSSVDPGGGAHTSGSRTHYSGTSGGARESGLLGCGSYRIREGLRRRGH